MNNYNPFKISAEILASVLKKQKDLSELVEVLYKPNSNNIIVKFKKEYCSKITGLSIVYPEDVFCNKDNKFPSIIEVILLGNYSNLYFDPYIGYQNEKRFQSIDDLCDEIIKIHHYRLY